MDTKLTALDTKVDTKFTTLDTKFTTLDTKFDNIAKLFVRALENFPSPHDDEAFDAVVQEMKQLVTPKPHAAKLAPSPKAPGSPEAPEAPGSPADLTRAKRRGDAAAPGSGQTKKNRPEPQNHNSSG